ncbi:fibronectin type III domain-containing protein [Streptomyces sp. NPDC005423]|uniref:fibronectin type III domain-containing protein n=1 Tax=Streptomyces sp. NPDC005423 TaxID=3155343 RepID=UPI0033B06408
MFPTREQAYGTRPMEAFRLFIGSYRVLAGFLCALLPLGVLAPPAHAAAAVTYFVSPGGSDSNPGTSAAAPFRTLTKAQSAVRAVDTSTSGPVTVTLAGGVYRLTKTLTFTAADSGGGTAGTVWWKAAAGQTPVISGGVPITGWTGTGTGGIWSAPAPSGLDTRQLYVDGVRARRATGSLPVSLTQTAAGYTTASGDPMAGWRNPSAIEFVYRGGLGLWTEPRCPVASVTSTAVTMGQPCWNNSTRRVMRTDGSGRTYNLVGRASITEAPTAVENAYELLDQPGEFYLDRSEHRFYYIPRPGENLSTADVEAPSLDTLVASSGSASDEPTHVGFQGIQFSYANYTASDTGTGFSEIQATYQVTGATGYATQGLCGFVPGGSCPYGNWTKMPGAVRFTYDKSIHFDHDYFVHLGAAGLDLGDGSQSDTVTACVFTDISGNGLDLGGVDIPQPTTSAQHTSAITVKDSHFYDTATEYHGGVAIDAGYIETSTVTHNQIDHVPYTAISIGWGGWPDKVSLPAQPNYSHHNTVSDNLIHDHMALLGDGGAVYTNGITGTSMASGEHVSGNVVHDQLNTSGGHVLYTDNGASYVSVLGNAVWNISVSPWGSKHVNYTLGDGTYDPTDIEGNYWPGGPADYDSKGVLIQDNHAVTGASEVPPALIAAAGIESPYRPILSWQPA